MNLRPLLNSLVHWNYVFLQKASEFVKESEREVFRNLCPHQPPPFLFSKTSATFRKEIFVI